MIDSTNDGISADHVTSDVTGPVAGDIARNSDELARIRSALQRAGLAEVPEDPHAPLADYGMDSLLMVLSVAELERAFGVTIDAGQFSEAAFDNLAAVHALLRRVGAA